MSRTFRYTHRNGHGHKNKGLKYRSEKKWRRAYNRAVRHANRSKIHLEQIGTKEETAFISPYNELTIANYYSSPRCP